jgi:ElaB/YqjD/DUF883 family membrane-anchored ribosome-binding protein
MTMVEPATDDRGDRLVQMREKAEESLRTASTRLGELKDAALEQSCAAGRATDEYVRANPWPFIAMGAAAGLALGVMVSRRGR